MFQDIQRQRQMHKMSFRGLLQQEREKLLSRAFAMQARCTFCISYVQFFTFCPFIGQKKCCSVGLVAPRFRKGTSLHVLGMERVSSFCLVMCSPQQHKGNYQGCSHKKVMLEWTKESTLSRLRFGGDKIGQSFNV